MTIVKDFISDEQVELVHANANYSSLTRCFALEESLLKLACGYSISGVATQTLTKHGLVAPRKNPHKLPILTKTGRRYLYRHEQPIKQRKKAQ